jgi:hypothetical protein
MALLPNENFPAPGALSYCGVGCINFKAKKRNPLSDPSGQHRDLYSSLLIRSAIPLNSGVMPSQL